MSKSHLGHIIILTGGMLLTGAALAQSAPNFEKCTSRATALDDRITACSRAIKSGKLSSQHLIAAYNIRGYSWHLKGDDDKAIADLGEVIRLTPQDARAYINRGSARAQKGDFDKAIADFNDAVRLAPNESDAYFYRGLALFCRGKYDAAVTDFSEAQRLKAGDAYIVLWRFLALARDQKSEEAKQLLADVASIDQAKWPAPVINLMVGKSDPEAVFKATENADKTIHNNQLCEAKFYVGEWFLLIGDSPKARPLFDQAVRECPRDFDEFSAASAELKRLPKQ